MDLLFTHSIENFQTFPGLYIFGKTSHLLNIVQKHFEKRENFQKT